MNSQPWYEIARDRWLAWARANPDAARAQMDAEHAQSDADNVRLKDERELITSSPESTRAQERADHYARNAQEMTR